MAAEKINKESIVTKLFKDITPIVAAFHRDKVNSLIVELLKEYCKARQSVLPEEQVSQILGKLITKIAKTVEARAVPDDINLKSALDDAVRDLKSLAGTSQQSGPEDDIGQQSKPGDDTSKGDGSKPGSPGGEGNTETPGNGKLKKRRRQTRERGPPWTPISRSMGENSESGLSESGEESPLDFLKYRKKGDPDHKKPKPVDEVKKTKGSDDTTKPPKDTKGSTTGEGTKRPPPRPNLPSK